MGYEALHDNTTGSSNTAVGYQAGDKVTTGGNNVFIGALTGNSTTTTSSNTYVGYNAGGGNASGEVNTYIGMNAGANMTTGGYNICLGYASNSSSNTSTGQCTLGDSNIGNLRCNVQSINSLSDRRDKTDIVDLPIGIDFIDKVRPVKFKWQTRDGNIKDGTYRAGFIAQELQTVESSTSVDYLNLVLDDNPDKLEASEGNLIPVLVKAVQELSAKVKELESKLN